MALTDPWVEPQHIGLRQFVQEAWHLVEPGVPLADDWALGAMCEFIEAWYDRQFAHGVIAVPPGMSKSLLSDVFAPAWAWGLDPSHKWLSVSYDSELTLRDARRTRAIIEADEYLQAYPGTRLLPGSAAASRLWTTARGLRFSTSISGRGIGWHFHSAVIDDPLKPQSVLGRSLDPIDYERVLQWHDLVLPTRRAEGYPFGSMLVMQRLSERDLSGTLQARDGYEALVLPMRYVPNAFWCQAPWTLRLEQRTIEGELLAPARATHTAQAVTEQERSLGHEAEAQLQQNPIPRTGGLLSEEDLRWEWTKPVPQRAQLVQVWDFAAKGTEASHSACCGQLWASCELEEVVELAGTIQSRGLSPERARKRYARDTGTYYLLIDEVHGRWSVPESERQFELAQGRPLWSRAGQRVIEAKAAGIGVIQRFERRFTGVIAFHEVSDDCAQLARDDKITRFRANLGEWAGARVLLPPEAWADDVRLELLKFPRGAHDDRVDCASMALAILTASTMRYWAAVAAVASQRRR